MKPNGIWATLGATSSASPLPTLAPLLPTNPAPSPMTPHINGSPADSPSSNGTENSDETSPEDQTVSFVQYPIPADYNPAQPTASPETLSDASHPYQDASTESPVTPIITPSKKPGHRNTTKYAWNGDLEEIPVEVIIEPVLKNKQRQHVVPGAVRSSRPTTRKYGRHNQKPGNKFGM